MKSHHIRCRSSASTVTVASSTSASSPPQHLQQKNDSVFLFKCSQNAIFYQKFKSSGKGGEGREGVVTAISPTQEDSKRQDQCMILSLMGTNDDESSLVFQPNFAYPPNTLQRHQLASCIEAIQFINDGGLRDFKVTIDSSVFLLHVGEYVVSTIDQIERTLADQDQKPQRNISSTGVVVENRDLAELLYNLLVDLKVNSKDVTLYFEG